ncbi:MAG TPA: discoidin domain-containing protein [Bacillota bacterium]|nr:discoidin domain-containing protein [Bacillota bacterium]
MKKLSIIIILALAFIISSCSPDVNVSTPESTASEQSSHTESSSSEVSDTSEPEITVIDRTQDKILISEGCKYTASGAPHSAYSDDGSKLTDGVFGGDIGVGWATTKGDFILDLGERRTGIADINILMRADNWGIVAGTTAEYYVSDDKREWTQIGTVSGDDVKKTPSDATWMEYSYLLELEEAVSARYVRFVVSGPEMNFAWVHELCVWKYESSGETVLHDFTGTDSFTNLTMTNGSDSDMGDQEAPGYCVYSIKGFNGVEMTVELSEIDVNTFDLSKGKRIAAYVFLGVNVYNSAGYWMNCADAGLVYNSEELGWRLFWATATDENGERGWFDGGKALNASHTYTITLTTSKKDGSASICAYDLTAGEEAETLTFDLYGSKKDGSNTSFLTDIAIDWANDATWTDSEGNPSRDWEKVFNAALGSGMYMKNVRIYGCSLYKGEEKLVWEEKYTHVRGIWPDGDSVIKAETTVIRSRLGDTEYIIDLDLG